MFDWKENINGNYVHVFYQDDLLIGSYDTPEEAQDAMERYIEGDTNLVMPINNSGRAKKDGNFYQKSRYGIAKVHQAKNGMWYITINGEIVKNLWLNTESEAIYVCADIMRQCAARACE